MDPPIKLRTPAMTMGLQFTALMNIPPVLQRRAQNTREKIAFAGCVIVIFLR
jgi:hypothetical protein